VTGGNPERVARKLTLLEARESPCMSCVAAPCCTHLPLHTFQVRTLLELDHASYLLNFSRIRLGLHPNGDFSVYYRYPCRFLDRSDPVSYRCQIHGRPEQPSICVHYNPYACWYRPALSADSAHFIQLDWRRFERLAERLEFDDRRDIVGVPVWSSVLEELAALPLEPGFDDDLTPDPVFDGWLTASATGAVEPAAAPRGYGDFVDPCAGCAAFCCTTLVFPLAVPVGRVNFDYLQFALGFPGVEVGVSDGQWLLVVKSRCRHLGADNRCAIYGRPERPMLCKYFDATSCSYVARFGKQRPRGFLRVRHEQYPWLLEAVRFDDEGQLTHLPPTETLREHIETRWREALSAAAAEAPDA